MSILISGFCFIQAVILRACFCLVFAGLTVAAHTAQSQENLPATDLDILTIQPARADTDRLLPYRLNLNVALTRSADTPPFGSGFGNTSMLENIAGPTKETVWPTNAPWQFTPNNAPVSLRTLLRFESKDERLDIKPKRHSFSVEWRKSF